MFNIKKLMGKASYDDSTSSREDDPNIVFLSSS